MPFFAFLTVVDAFRIQIMVQQAVTCEVLPFRSENAIVAEWIDGLKWNLTGMPLFQ